MKSLCQAGKCWHLAHPCISILNLLKLLRSFPKVQDIYSSETEISFPAIIW